MDTTTRTRRLGAVAAALLAVASLAGCIIPAPVPSTPQTTEPTSAPPTTQPATDPTESAPTTGQYALQNDPDAAVVWSFEATEAQRTDADANGVTAEPGQQLVILHLSGEVLRGEPDFYYQFRVQLIDEPSGQAWGLSSGTYVYAENDLFYEGRQPSFVDAEAIYQVPDTWALDTWRIICNETGESWDVTVPVV